MGREVQCEFRLIWCEHFLALSSNDRQSASWVGRCDFIAAHSPVFVLFAVCVIFASNNFWRKSRMLAYCKRRNQPFGADFLRRKWRCQYKSLLALQRRRPLGIRKPASRNLNVAVATELCALLMVSMTHHNFETRNCDHWFFAWWVNLRPKRMLFKFYLKHNHE